MKCTPQLLATLTDRIALTGARERIARKVYVRATFDAARPRPASVPGWRGLEIPCGHDAVLDMPERLAEILVEAA